MSSKPPCEPIAIVGMACIYPGAPNLKRYWENIVNGVDAITDVPEQRWAKVYYDPDSSEVDRFYCKRGGFVDDYVEFDPLKYGVMPKAARSADPDQLLSLRVGVEALDDAGYSSREFARDKTGVIIGRGNYLSAGTLRLEQHVRLVQQTLQTLKDLVPGISDEQLQEVREQLRSKLDYYGPDVAVGMIPNLVASRLANRLDLHGPAYTVDAACASSVIAIEQACELLRSGQCDMMLAGGLHFTHDLTFWATFCQLGALSRTQMVRPFAEDADGILAGEGIGLLVLKRQQDAERDGDRIYALINGVASSSDGRSSSLLAPAVEGQLLALQRAWAQTALDRDRIGLVEAHGTGTPSGDEAELETLKQFFGAWSHASPRPVLGSVKSMIGHTMPAAGVAGVIKAALSLYHGVLPPTLHCERPHTLLDETRFRVLQRQEVWPEPDSGHPRVAAVNAFGFGGINGHVVMSASSAGVAKPVSRGVTLPKVVTIAADSQEDMLVRLQRREWDQSAGSGSWRLAIVEPTDKRIELALKVVAKGLAWHGRNHIFFSRDGMISNGGKIAFLFPGVDSSFEPQAEDVAAYFDMPLSEFCTTADPAEVLFRVVLGLNKFNHLMFNVLSKLRIKADGLAGHSIGEFSAMAAGGMLSQARVDAVMGVLENDPTTLQVPDVIFLAAACGVEIAEAAIDGLQDICISHDNCPRQIILCGRKAAVDAARQRLNDQNVLTQQLPFVSGFHSPMFAGHMQQYRDFYAETDLHEPHIPVWSATTGEIFPASMEEKKQLALDHLLQPVRFRNLIENLYADGYRAFIQVGTGSLLGFVDDTLKHHPHLSVSANIPKRSGMEQLCHLVAALWVEGATLDLSLLGYGEGSPQAAEKSTSTIRLHLGVPLIKLDRPLQIRAPASNVVAPVLPMEGSDPLQNMFNQTLATIQQASLDVVNAWQARKGARVPSKELPLSVFPSVTLASAARSASPFRKIVRQHLDVNANVPYVMDHELYPQRKAWPVLADRHPVIPLTMEIMLLREAIEQSLPGYVVIRFEKVHAFNWLVVDKPTDVNIHMHMRQYPEIEVGIEGYMKAKAIVDDCYPSRANRLESQRSGVFERRTQSDRTTRFENQRNAAIDAKNLYEDQWMFHGPAYQGVVELGPIADNGICGRLRVPSGKGALLDNMGQLAGYWVMEQDSDCLAMPISVDKISFYGPDPGAGEEFDCKIWVRHLDGTSCVTDQRLINDQGQVVITMDGWQTRRYQMDRDFFMQTKQVQRKLVCEALDDGVVLFRDRFDTAIVRDYMARRYINQPEMVEYEATSPRRRRQWLNGRIAAKDAVRKYLWSKHGLTDLFPKEFLIRNAAQGQPLVEPHITGCFSEKLHLSIAHKDLLAVAMAAEKPVGVDIEIVEARTQEFADLTFGGQEQAILPDNERDEWMTRFWVAKEAVAKCMGTGLEGRPKQFQVMEIDGENLRVNDQWVTTRRKDNYIIGWTI